MTLSRITTAPPPLTHQTLRRNPITVKLATLQVGQAFTVTDIDPRCAAKLALNRAKKVGIRITTRKVSGIGLSIYRLA